MSEHDLRDLEEAGFDIMTQCVVISKQTLAARCVIQYSKTLVTSDVIERILSEAATQLAEDIADSLNQIKGKES